MIINDVLEKMSNAPTLSECIAQADSYRIRFNAEFLNGCQFNCAGCFVNRKVKYDPSDVSYLAEMIRKLKSDGVTVDEIILGATDFFGAYNTIDIIRDDNFNKLFDDGSIVLTFLSTLQSDDNRINEVIDVFNTSFSNPETEVEFLIPIDVKAVLINDREYINSIKHKLKLIERMNVKIDYALQVNIRNIDNEIEDFDMVTVCKRVRDEFKTILEFNPSFMRSGNISKVKDTLKAWNKMLERCVTEDSKDSVILTVSNKYHAGSNERTFTIKNGELYLTPFIYENVIVLNNKFKLPKDKGLVNWDVGYEAQQYNYISQTDSCSECEFVSSCISKLVLKYMEEYDIKECLLSRKTMRLYAN